MRSQLRARMIAVGGTLALTMSFTAAVAFATSGDKSTGGVGFTTMAGGSAHASFTAHDTLASPDPDKGRVNVRGVGAGGTVFYKGTVDCYQRLSDNSARFSGVVTQTNDPFMRGFFEVAVEDNGSPGSNGDRISQALFPTSQADGSKCGVLTPTALVQTGNLVVHHKPL